jgi:hypothetical protein
VADLQRATGIDYAEAPRLVQRAIGGRPHRYRTIEGRAATARHGRSRPRLMATLAAWPT